MATLNLTITLKTEPGFDDVDVTVKQVKCDIDGDSLTRKFSYTSTTNDAYITADVRAKLAAEGHVFD